MKKQANKSNLTKKQKPVKKAIIVHRWSGSPNTDWYPWLKKELVRKGYEVVVPKLEPQHHPKITEWTNSLRQAAGKIDKETIIIGHSVGCQTIIRFLEKQNNKVKAVIFVAGWFTLKGLEDDESRRIAKPWLTEKIDFSKVKNKAESFTAIFSSNDPYVEYDENKKLFEENLGAKTILIEDKEHFAGKKHTKLPAVLKAIR